MCSNECDRRTVAHDANTRRSTRVCLFFSLFAVSRCKCGAMNGGKRMMYRQYKHGMHACIPRPFGSIVPWGGGCGTCVRVCQQHILYLARHAHASVGRPSPQLMTALHSHAPLFGRSCKERERRRTHVQRDAPQLRQQHRPPSVFSTYASPHHGLRIREP